MTWQPGCDTIAELLAGGDLEQVAADERLARRMLEDAGRHLDTGRTASKSDDLAGAYQLAYDALRKSAASLLAVQGLRATSRGGHVAVQQAVNAQFATTVRVFRAFGRIRRARNSFEYPESDTGGPTADDVDDALTVAGESHAAAMTILDKQLLTPWTTP
ncbi:hypothetical protein [Actinopolymorpha rutila]|uniref:HEPN domain-containing protein n=1 Tax=Actinopolymorpha rutila TaxID=446787 RepID=A0A852ZGE8_9ACTN|nr:hypothetical protein [Actinopolymorpha rutila]NYH92241.1 hypothetical protein [Actinopolymorpha rutila]